LKRRWQLSGTDRKPRTRASDSTLATTPALPGLLRVSAQIRGRLDSGPNTSDRSSPKSTTLTTTFATQTANSPVHISASPWPRFPPASQNDHFWLGRPSATSDRFTRVAFEGEPRIIASDATGGRELVLYSAGVLLGLESARPNDASSSKIPESPATPRVHPPPIDQESSHARNSSSVTSCWRRARWCAALIASPQSARASTARSADSSKLKDEPAV
jgi:hypothetical protein